MVRIYIDFLSNQGEIHAHIYLSITFLLVGNKTVEHAQKMAAEQWLSQRFRPSNQNLNRCGPYVGSL